MRRLSIEYEIKNMSVLYEETTALWDNAEFTFNKDFTAHLKLWEDDIEPEQISETWKSLEDRAESFWVALKYLGNHSLERKKKGYPTYYFDDRQFTPRTEKEIFIITDYLRGRRDSFGMLRLKVSTPKIRIIASVTSSPAPLPPNMLSVPPNLHWIAETIIVADKLANYPDLVLKLAYIILEEFKNDLSKDEFERFQFVRDFVSHPICDKKKSLKDYIGRVLPSSKTINDKGEDAVRFNRNDNNHIAFITKYAYPAIQRAKELFNDKVKIEGGFLKG